MHDFMRFMRHLFRIIHFIRGVVWAFALLLALCTLVVILAEDMKFGQAVYFVMVTALTIGYGDITPTTAWGQIASVATGIFGLLISGIVVAVAVRALALAYHEKLNEKGNGEPNSGETGQ